MVRFRPSMAALSEAAVSQSVVTPRLWCGTYRRFLKRWLDIGISLGALIFLLPPMGLIYFVVRLDGGPGLFVHWRVGMHGCRFGCLKFRTMVVDAEAALSSYLAWDQEAKAEWEQTRKLKNDPRVTLVGGILRKTSADELPQILNVLLGDMSIVGPRPVTSSELVKYGDSAPICLSVRPGITGLWQVGGRNLLPYESRVRLDVEYCKNCSFGLDVKLIIRTFVETLNSKGAF